MDWRKLQFNEFTNTCSEQVIEYGIFGAYVSTRSTFVEDYKNGQALRCIVEALANVVATERLIAERGRFGDRVDLGFDFVRDHSGQDWEFWYELARLGLLAETFPAENPLNVDAQRVLSEMNLAFAPYLVPRNLSKRSDIGLELKPG
ncbi:MAG: hypothetical protein GY835_13790 [bacterium]|nr:hypothetical protein [bacterium]